MLEKPEKLERSKHLKLVWVSSVLAVCPRARPIRPDEPVPLEREKNQ